MAKVKRRYTQQIHAKRVEKILNKPNTCNKCPAAPYYDETRSVLRSWDNAPCQICRRFIHLTFREAPNRCPCVALGESLAAKRTWLALEEKGYLDD